MPATQELLNQGRYRIVQPLSSNGVFNAYDTVGNVNVVVKEIPVKLGKVTTLSQQESMKLAFANQARILKDLRHEHILNVEDYFCDVGRQFLVLESVEGESLHSILQRSNGQIESGKAVNWAGQLLGAIEFLASRNIGFVHGKINPHNIYVTSDGRVKLVSVRVSDGDDMSFDTSLETGDDQTETLCYSPLEMIWESLDPASQKVISNSYDERSEAILLQPPDARSDVYSIGAVVYHLVTGKKPVDALERSIELLESNPDPLTPPDEVPQTFSEFVLKALEIKREDRFDNAAVMGQALKTLMLRLSETSAEARSEEKAAESNVKAQPSVRPEDVQRIIEAKKREFEEEKQRQERLLQEKLRQAEEQRLLAEKRAAEAERLLREREAPRAAAITTIAPEDDLLGIAADTSDAPNTEAAKPAFSVEPAAAETRNLSEVIETHATSADRDASVGKHSTEPVTTAALEKEELPTVPQEAVETVEHVIEIPVTDVIIEPSYQEMPSYDLTESYEPAGRSFPVAAIAGAVAVLLVVVVGAWVFLSGGPATSNTPVQSSVPPVSEPVQPAAESQPQAENAVEPTAENAFHDSTQDSETIETFGKAAVTAPTPERKRTPVAEPTKAKPEQAKKVTVDDLINDN